MLIESAAWIFDRTFVKRFGGYWKDNRLGSKLFPQMESMLSEIGVSIAAPFIEL